MPDDTTVSSGEQKEQRSLPVEYQNINEVPIYSCDHIFVTIMPTDESFVLQMFSTIPPILDLEDEESPSNTVIRKCVGQFHLTPKYAQDLVNTLQRHLTEFNKGQAT